MMSGGSTAARFAPERTGIGLRAPHYRDLLETRPAAGFLEVHSENYFGAGGAPLYYLEQARRDYPLSLHGVGLSLGGSDPLDRRHLRRLKALIARFEPALVSDHLCWCAVDGIHLHDLLPLPYTEEALAHTAARLGAVQDFLGREILIENPSSYLSYTDSVIPEEEFLAELVRQSGGGILLDVNNLYVSSRNHGFDPLAYLAALPPDKVREIHLAGHTVKRYAEGEILLDTHNAPVCAEVWQLYRKTVQRFGEVPTLIEWDSDLPPLATLVEEAARADAVRKEVTDVRAG